MVGPETYFAHVKQLDWADDLREVTGRARESPIQARHA